jgi:hypothetical protein
MRRPETILGVRAMAGMLGLDTRLSFGNFAIPAANARHDACVACYTTEIVEAPAERNPFIPARRDTGPPFLSIFFESF